LLAALAFLNNSHSFDLCTCCAGMKSLSRANLVPAMALCPCSAAWRSSLVANFSSIALRRAPIAEAEAHVVASRCCVVTTTLVRNLIWPCNSSVLSRCTSSFSVSPSLASKPVRCKLSLRSSCLGASTRVSTARLTT